MFLSGDELFSGWSGSISPSTPARKVQSVDLVGDQGADGLTRSAP